MWLQLENLFSELYGAYSACMIDCTNVCVVYLFSTLGSLQEKMCMYLGNDDATDVTTHLNRIILCVSFP